MNVFTSSVCLNYGSTASLKNNHQKNPSTKTNHNKTQEKIPEAKRNMLTTRLPSSIRWAPHFKCSITNFSKNFQRIKGGIFVS